MKELKFFKCQKCGNVVLEVLNQGPQVHCCGEPMKELVPGTTDAATEKHVPAVTRDGNKIDVVVGSTEHPMEEKHWIVVIATVQGEKVQVQYLTHEDEPRASFEIEDGPVVVYEYCNLHGLWKAEA